MRYRAWSPGLDWPNFLPSSELSNISSIICEDPGICSRMSHRPASRTHGPGQALRLSALPGPVACAARTPEMIGGEAAFSLFLPVRQRAPGGSHGVLGLLVVLRPSFGREPAAWPMH